MKNKNCPKFAQENLDNFLNTVNFAEIDEQMKKKKIELNLEINNGNVVKTVENVEIQR